MELETNRDSGLWFVLAVMLMVGGLILLGVKACGSPEERAAARTREIQAESQAAAERAAIREAARQAGHERALEALPFLVVIVGLFGLAGFGAFAVWDLLSQRQGRHLEESLYMLYRMQLEQQRIWRLLAQVERRGLIIHETDEPLMLPEEED